MTKLEIIDETVAYYSEDTSRRGLVANSSQCVYKSEEGKMCAVGRCLNWKKLPKDIERVNKTGSVRGLAIDMIGDDNSIDSILIEKYKGHSIGFWSALQTLHDGAPYWDEKGLTEDGQAYLTILKFNYSN